MRARRFRRYGRRVAKRFSSETYNFTDGFTAGAGQASAVMVDATAVKGVRKVKNFRITIATDIGVPCAWAVVYVPEGLSPSVMSIGTANMPASLYEPNQNVIMSGILSAQPGNAQVYSTRLARILNSGDKIVFLFKPVTDPGQGHSIVVNLNYAIAY